MAEAWNELGISLGLKLLNLDEFLSILLGNTARIRSHSLVLTLSRLSHLLLKRFTKFILCKLGSLLDNHNLVHLELHVLGLRKLLIGFYSHI